MKLRWHPVQPTVVSPTLLFLVVLAVIFIVEAALMVALPWLMGPTRSATTEMIFDASLLTLLASPILWWVIVLPLRKLIRVRTELLAKLIDAQEDERERISRDLHDGVGQALTSLRVGLKLIESAKDLEGVRAQCQKLRAVAAATHEDVGRMARGLRPVVLSDLGLNAALERLTQDIAGAHHFAVTLDAVMGDARLDTRTETAIYRIVQESLTNVVRHAHATRAGVQIRREGAWVELSVRDDGKGFETSRIYTGLGLSGMRQRADMLGGTLSIRSRDGEGTIVTARVPATEAGNDQDANSTGG